MTPELRENVLAFYANPDAPLPTMRQRKVWKRVPDELQQLERDDGRHPEGSRRAPLAKAW